tara:strand:+ start:52 stop:510 length:459 start_codon:yes stop_codon:yes gene_type:complete
MTRIKNFALLFFLFLLLSCAYEPVLNNKNYEFSLKVIKLDGDQKINSKIVENLKYLKEKQKKYDLIITSTKEKKVLSKDSKGDPSIFELLIFVNYIVNKDGNILFTKNISRKTTYNNINDKFELENYEKNIITNLAKNISDKIILSVSEIHK